MLGLGIGGTQVLAANTSLRWLRSSLLWSAAAGTAMLTWIFIEVAMLDGLQCLQAFYFAVGRVEIILVLALLGIRPSVAASGTSADSQDLRPMKW